MVFCKLRLVYIFDKLGIRVEMRKAKNIRVKVPLLLVKDISANLFLSTRTKLWQIFSLAIWLVW